MTVGINQSYKTRSISWIQNQNSFQSKENDSTGKFDYLQCCALACKDKIQIKYFQLKNNNLKTTNIIELINSGENE